MTKLLILFLGDNIPRMTVKAIIFLFIGYVPTEFVNTAKAILIKKKQSSQDKEIFGPDMTENYNRNYLIIATCHNCVGCPPAREEFPYINRSI